MAVIIYTNGTFRIVRPGFEALALDYCERRALRYNGPVLGRLEDIEDRGLTYVGEFGA